jgi:plastocyanin
VKRDILLTIILALSATLLFGCSSYSTPTATPPATTPATSGNAVTLSNFLFSPATLTVKVGTTVTWTNKDGVTHTVTSDSDVFNSGNLAPNATYSFTFSNAGTFAYHCSIHTSMKGTIIVQ